VKTRSGSVGSLSVKLYLISWGFGDIAIRPVKDLVT
jgi:hypothetical protein